jgi:histidyl-tRNA synthetase
LSGFTSELGAQGTVCAGGRYDGLVEQLGGKATPGIGFAMGLERLVLLLKQHTELQSPPHACLILMGELAVKFGLQSAEKLRDAIPSLRLLANLSAGGFKTQFKRADKSGARYALIIGDSEAQAGKISLKDLRLEQAQQELTLDELIDFFCKVMIVMDPAVKPRDDRIN